MVLVVVVVVTEKFSALVAAEGIGAKVVNVSKVSTGSSEVVLFAEGVTDDRERVVLLAEIVTDGSLEVVKGARVVVLLSAGRV